MKTAGMLPAASENWEEALLPVPPLQEPFLEPRAISNPEAAGQEQEGSQEPTLVTEKSQEKSRASAEKGKG